MLQMRFESKFCMNGSSVIDVVVQKQGRSISIWAQLVVSSLSEVFFPYLDDLIRFE